VAVVSWNTRELLERCLGSLWPEVDAGRAEVWVVDNASTDGSSSTARRAAPWATLIDAGRNLGFGRAVNLVASKTDTEWIAAANADTALQPGALEALLAAGAEPGVGAVAPRLVLPDGSVQHSVYPFPSLRFTVAFNLGLHRLTPRLGDRLCLEGFWNPWRPRSVDWAIGAFLLLRRRAYDEVGGFDERQWMYAEDLDLGWRLRDHGWTTRFEPRAAVLHHAGAATTTAFGHDRTANFTAATYGALARRRGAFSAWITAIVNCLGAVGRLAWLTPMAHIAPRRFEAARASNRRWLAAHRQGLRRRGALLRQA
jgi:N-acetylglucosaminyl-diphospho-decaprenol L-rhamnosyltransferase